MFSDELTKLIANQYVKNILGETTLLNTQLTPQQQHRFDQLAAIAAARNANYQSRPTTTSKWKALEAVKALRAKRSPAGLATGQGRGIVGNIFDRRLSPEDALRNDRNRRLMGAIRRTSRGDENVLHWALNNPGAQTGT